MPSSLRNVSLRISCSVWLVFSGFPILISPCHTGRLIGIIGIIGWGTYPKVNFHNKIICYDMLNWLFSTPSGNPIIPIIPKIALCNVHCERPWTPFSLLRFSDYKATL